MPIENSPDDQENLDAEIEALIAELGKISNLANAVVYELSPHYMITAVGMIIHLQKKDDIGLAYLKWCKSKGWTPKVAKQHPQEDLNTDEEFQALIAELQAFNANQQINQKITHGVITAGDMVKHLQARDEIGSAYLNWLKREKRWRLPSR